MSELKTYKDPVSLQEVNVAAIDAAANVDRALQMTHHHQRIAYIKAVAGHRAVGGFFDPTRANVTAKFRAVWTARHEALVQERLDAYDAIEEGWSR